MELVVILSCVVLFGVRKPLASHEQPITRTYLAVENIDEAVKQAAAAGATVAYGPTRQGERGTFAILIQGGVHLAALMELAIAGGKSSSVRREQLVRLAWGATDRNRSASRD